MNDSSDRSSFVPCPGGLPGKCFVPPADAQRKHPCRDCFSCQWCSDDRCALCRARQQAGAGPLPPREPHR